MHLKNSGAGADFAYYLKDSSMSEAKNSLNFIIMVSLITKHVI